MTNQTLFPVQFQSLANRWDELDIYMSFLTGGVDEVTKDSEGAHPASLVTVLQPLKNKHDQPVWKAVSYTEKETKLDAWQ